MSNSLGYRFLRTAIKQNAVALLRNHSDRDLYLDEERGAFDAVAAHVASYGQMPSAQALAVEGVQLGPSNDPEPCAYYAAQLRRRAAYNAVNSKHPLLAESLRNRDMDQALVVLRDMLSEAAGKVEASNYSSLSTEAQRVIDDYSFAKSHPGLRGVGLRWDTLNQATNGAMGGDLIVVAGRPGMGKSWIMLELALDAHRKGRSIAFASMEMSLTQIARRWIGGMTGINPNDIRAGNLAHWSEAEMLQKVADLSSAAPVHLFRGDMKKNVAGIAQMMDEFEPDVLYVDAAYLLSPAARKSGYVSRWEAISDVIRELKQLALHKDRPIIVSVQFNRNQKNRASKKSGSEVPDLSDIAGSDSIPQDASIVLGVSPWKPPFNETRRMVHVMKNREGEVPTFGINFRFNPVNFDEVLIEDEINDAPIVDTSWML
jgi:replicative DNA helicase